MPEDTAQTPQAPAETLLETQFANAAAEMQKRRELPQQPRDDQGKFKSVQERAAEAEAQDATEIPDEDPDYAEEAQDQPDEALADADEAQDDYDTEDDAEAPDEDQVDAIDMPKSWNKDMAETWAELPHEVQAKIAERENQRDMAVNSKFQEVANARKQYEELMTEANASRDKWANDYDLLVADLELPRPQPQQFGYGTRDFDRAAYDSAVIEWEQGTQQLETLRAQRQQIAQQQQEEQLKAWHVQKQSIEDAWRPKLLEEMPDIADPAKQEPALRELVNFALEQGLPPETFSEENQHFITSAQLRLLALAKQAHDAKSKVKKAPPKKQPALKPGTPTTRQARKSVQREKAMQNLEASGSIEDAVRAMQARRA